MLYLRIALAYAAGPEREPRVCFVLRTTGRVTLLSFLMRMYSWLDKLNSAHPLPLTLLVAVEPPFASDCDPLPQIFATILPIFWTRWLYTERFKAWTMWISSYCDLPAGEREAEGVTVKGRMRSHDFIDKNGESRKKHARSWSYNCTINSSWSTRSMSTSNLPWPDLIQSCQFAVWRQLNHDDCRRGADRRFPLLGLTRLWRAC